LALPLQITVTPDAHGLAAFMFADIRGFTNFTGEHGDEAAHKLVMLFRGMVARYAVSQRGRKVKEAGDTVLVVFPTARQALNAAGDLMSAIAEHNADR